MKKAFPKFLAAAAIVLLSHAAMAGTNLLVTGGTHVRDGATAMGYITGQLESSTSAGSESIDLTKPEFSVYRKNGLPATPGSYELVGVMRPVVDEASVAALLERSWQLKLGTSPAELEAQLGDKLDTMFGELKISASTQTVAAKLATVILASLADPQYRGDLALLGKTFPGVNMCLGNAWAGPISTAGPTTFELRLRDASGADAAVAARITIDGSNPTPTLLPAPGSPRNAGIEVSASPLPPTAFSVFRTNPANEAKAEAGFEELKTQMAGRRVNRAVRLRWSTPDALRQRSILQNGYNLWRIPAATIQSAHPDWLASGAPSAEELVAAGAVKANTLPIMIAEELSPAEASDPADTETNFFTDSLSSNLTLTGATGSFAYFVTAVDILGRDGGVSPGTVVSIINRMPPSVVEGLKVTNDYVWNGSVGKQRLKLAWSPATTRWPKDGPDDGGSLEYEIYRWDRYDGAQRSVGATPIFTTSSTSFTDAVAGFPNEASARQTFWYTVRAVKVTSGGRFAAGHSSPVFGVIRERSGPSLFLPWIFRPCIDLTVTAKPSVPVTNTDLTVGRLIPVTLSCLRQNEGIAWAEFSVVGQATPLAKVLFDESNIVEHVLNFEASAFPVEGPSLANIQCRVGSVNGAVSGYVAANPPGAFGANTQTLGIPFEATLSVTMVDSEEACPEGGQLFPIDPSGSFTGISGGVKGDPDTAEVKYFRRINDGPLTFIARTEEVPVGPLVESDFLDPNPPPLNGGRVCYYAQAFDSDGNGGPMLLLRCNEFAPLALPRPVLDPIVPNPAAPDGSRSLKIHWSCSPVGVDRFKVYVSKGGELPSADLGAEFLGSNISTQGAQLSGQGSKTFGVYLTARVEGRFSGNATAPLPAEPPSEFTFDLPAENGEEYIVAVSAVGAPGDAEDGYPITEGKVSNVRAGKWSQENTASPNVPWPARPIAKHSEVDEVFLGAEIPPGLQRYPVAPALTAQVLSGDFDGVGIRIGQISCETSAPDVNGIFIFNNKRLDPFLGVYRTHTTRSNWDGSSSSLLPCALYRYRVKNASDPGNSADLAQASPLMESIAYGFVNPNGTVNQGGGPNTAIYDPFVCFRNNGAANGLTNYGIYLKDTLPVVRGATYRYILVRFRADSHEPRDIIPVPDPVTVP